MPPRGRRRHGAALLLLATKTAASTLSLRPKAAIKPQINIVDYPPAPPDPTDFSFDYDAAEAAANAPRLLTKDEEVALARSVQRLRTSSKRRSRWPTARGAPRSSYRTPSGPRRWVWTLST